jgi:hypothetical protein
MSKPIKRNPKGRFEKGTSGNPLGRPMRAKRRNTPEQARGDFLELMGRPVKIVEGGKQTTVTASQALDRKQLALALAGSRISIQQIKAREAAYAKEIFAELTDLHEQVVTGEKIIRENPDDVTDEYVELIRQCRKALNRLLG